MKRRNVAALYRDATATAREEHAERCRLVALYDDLTKRLTMWPLNFEQAQQWTGFIPPFMIEGPYDKLADRDSWVRNPSHRRVHLVAIVHEAYARTYGEQVGHAWIEEINTNRWADDWSPHDALRRAASRLKATEGN